jgi:hypothetical protein
MPSFPPEFAICIQTWPDKAENLSNNIQLHGTWNNIYDQLYQTVIINKFIFIFVQILPSEVDLNASYSSLIFSCLYPLIKKKFVQLTCGCGLKLSHIYYSAMHNCSWQWHDQSNWYYGLNWTKLWKLKIYILNRES